MRPTVVLFDVDGTLITTGGAGRRAIERAFEAFAGRRDATEGLVFGGMTDRGIARYGLRRLGLPDDEATIDAFLDVYLSGLADEVDSAPHYRALPGVEAVLESLAGCGDLAVGLGTGNVEPGARIKLARVDLGEEVFPFGGFGCDAEDRGELLRAGARRGADRLGVPLEACRVVVIGDTPRDVAAARAIGADCLAVATGGADLETLRGCAPDRLVAELAEDGVGHWIRGA